MYHRLAQQIVQFFVRKLFHHIHDVLHPEQLLPDPVLLSRSIFDIFQHDRFPLNLIFFLQIKLKYKYSISFNYGNRTNLTGQKAHRTNAPKEEPTRGKPSHIFIFLCSRRYHISFLYPQSSFENDMLPEGRR